MEEELVKENIIMEKSLAFSVRMVNLHKYLSNVKKEYVISKQVYKSGTSIGANIAEAQRAQSTADFVNKLEIALKECYETDYWLEILFKVGSMEESTYKTLANKCGAIRRKLIASITTAKENV